MLLHFSDSKRYIETSSMKRWHKWEMLLHFLDLRRYNNQKVCGFGGVLCGRLLLGLRVHRLR